MSEIAFDCAWCGKHVEMEWINGRRPRYCCTDCRKSAKNSINALARENRKKLKGLSRKQKIIEWRQRQKTPLVSTELCNHCQWGVYSQSNMWCCGYTEVHEHTRTSMHPGGLTSQCQEFTERTGSRLNLRQAMSLTKVPSNLADRSQVTEIDPDFVRLQKKIRRYLDDQEE